MSLIRDNEQDFFYEVAAGRVPGKVAKHIVGFNPDVDTAPVDVWDGDALYVWPTTARLHDFSSDDASDAAAGTGARTARIHYLDATGLEATEDVTLNGTTPVTTAATMTAINFVEILTAGSTSSNVGTITFTAQTDNTISSVILPTNNSTLQAIYQVPSDKQALAVSFFASTDRGECAVTFFNQPTAGLFIRRFKLQISASASSIFLLPLTLPILFSPGTRLRVEVQASNNNTDIRAGFGLITEGV